MTSLLFVLMQPNITYAGCWRKVAGGCGSKTSGQASVTYRCFAGDNCGLGERCDNIDGYLTVMESCSGGGGGGDDQTGTSSPIGILDEINCNKFYGWGGDLDDKEEPINVKFYYDTVDEERYLGSTRANVTIDTCSAQGYTQSPCSHGFQFNTPASVKDGNQHRIYAVGVNIAGTAGENKQLTNSPKKITCQGLTATPTPTGTRTPTNLPTVTPTSAPTPTPDPLCLCGSQDVCDVAHCAFEKFSDATYSSPIKCNLSSDLFSATPSADNKTNWCRALKRTKGDADGNWTINNLDYFYYVAVVNGGKIPPSVNPDFNGDGEVGAADRAIIVKTLGS